MPFPLKNGGNVKRYRCIRKCFHNITKNPNMTTLFEEGQIVDVGDDVVMPRHFELIETAVVKAELKAETAKAEAKPEPAKELSEKDQLEAIYVEMDKLGKAYDRRWGLKRMVSELALAKKGM